MSNCSLATMTDGIEDIYKNFSLTELKKEVILADDQLGEEAA